MGWSEAEIRKQLELGEDSRWEFKQIEFRGSQPVGPRRDDLADEIAAFSNSDGGVLLCGVSDAGEVQGMSRAQLDALERVLIEICRDLIKPPIAVQLFRTALEDGKPFLGVSVDRGYAQHDSPGGSYERFGSSKRKMTSDDRMRLAQRRGQARFPWFDKQPVAGTGFGTLEKALWRPLLSVQGAADPRLGLAKMGLLSPGREGEARATVAGLLLCTSNPENWLPNACITATRYRGLDRASGQIDAQTITGPLNRQIAEAVAFAVRNMQVAAIKMPARLDQPQYSERAIFEAVVNAVAHRDYSVQGSRIRLSMFSDRLEIQSPGGLPNNLTIEELGYRQSTRNELLTSHLGRMSAEGVQGARDRLFLIERRGDGIPIIQRETREVSGNAPAFRLIGTAELCVTLPAASLESSPGRAVVTARAVGQPLPGADILILFPNRMQRRAVTDAKGRAVFELHTTHLPLTVFGAIGGHGALKRIWTPSEGPLALDFAPLPQGGAIIFEDGAGPLPGLSGQLHPIRDALDRTYVYGSNLAISEGLPQPVPLEFGEELQLTDYDGANVWVRILDIVGRASLVEYRPHRARAFPDR